MQGPISESNKTRNLPGGCLILFGSVFLTAGLGGGVMLLFVPLMTYFQATTWPSTPCVITAGRIEEVRGDDDTTYRAEFTYQYSVAKREYIGTRDRIQKSSGARSSARKRLEALPVGTRTICWYNPSDPSDSLLDRSLSDSQTLAGTLMFLVFSGVGGGIMYWGWSVTRRNRSGSSLGRQPLIGAPNMIAKTTAAEDLLDEKASGPQRLAPTMSRGTRLAFTLLFCLVWNGILSMVGYGFLIDGPFKATWAKIGMGIFFTPFVIVGLLMFYAVFHSALAMFCPAVSVALSSGAVARGEELDVAWEVGGGIQPISELTVCIIGIENAAYMQGTDLKTETSPFAVLHVITTRDPEEIRFGTRNIRIPLATMHSFDAPRNKIHWTIRVRGRIKWFPDANDEFPFRVLPNVVTNQGSRGEPV